jgi:hypothetical protein
VRYGKKQHSNRGQGVGSSKDRATYRESTFRLRWEGETFQVFQGGFMVQDDYVGCTREGGF